VEKYLIVIAIGYILGCFQWSYLLGKAFKKVDIRTLGNGNAGASNTVVSLGWKWGAIVAVLDILKAIISILIIKYLFKILVLKETDYYLYLNGLSVILGHNYPFYMGFKGGKGTASLIGMLAAIDYRIAILGIITIILITFITDYIALGTLGLVTLFVITTIIFKYSTGSIFIAIIIALLSLYNHIPNIKRILKKEETRLRNTMESKI
jgi:glycerol-3-phosphate acyltransferase PlsY